MGSLTICRGPSGVGKSTRVQVLLGHLMEEYEYETLYHDYTTSSGAIKQGSTGIHFPEINTLVMAVQVLKRKTGVLNWEGADHIKKNATAGMVHLGDLLRSHNDKNVIIEGYQPCNASSFRMRSEYILTKGPFVYVGKHKKSREMEHEGLGFDRHLKISFAYDTFEQAYDRVVGRGGDPINHKSPCWCDNSTNRVWHQREVEAIAAGQFGPELVSMELSWDSDINIVKDIWLDFTKGTIQ